MNQALSGLIVTAVTISVGTLSFFLLIFVWDSQRSDSDEAFAVRSENLDTTVVITSAKADDLGCDTFTATVENLGSTSISDFSVMNILVEYSDPTDAKIESYLAYGTDWSVTGISPDLRDSNIWDPGETATLALTLVPALKKDNSGVISISTPGGETDVAYLKCRFSYYLHSETTGISTTTYFQLKRDTPSDGVPTTTAATFDLGQTGRVRPSLYNGRFVFPLTGFSRLEASDWTVSYRVKREDVATSTLDGTKIAYTSDRDGNLEVYVMDRDGTDQTNLTTNSASDERPAWSPSGLSIAFATNRDGNWEIYVMDADGSNQANLTSNSAQDRYPAWSPDGSKIAFYSYRDGNWEIYVMNADGSGPANISNNSASDSFPTWSPDGSKIAFHTDRDGTFEIYTMDANGSDQTNISNDGVEAGAPDWSPDGTKIVFRSSRDGNKEIYVMNTDGSSQTRLTNNSAVDGDPSWSPDGSKIAFHSDRVGNYEIYAMDADGSSQTNLTSNAALESDASWSPLMPASHGFIWFEKAEDVSVTATGSWQDVDLTAFLPSGASGAVIELVNTTTTSRTGIARGREDTRNYMPESASGKLPGETHRWQIVKVDRNRVIQVNFEHIDIEFKLLGYTVGSDPMYFDIPPEITPETAGAWSAVDVSAYVDDGTDGVILLVNSTSSADRDYAIREIGSSDASTSYELDPYGNTMYMVGLDGSNRFEAYVQDDAISIFLVARTKGSVVYYGDDIAVTDPLTGEWQTLDADDYGIPAGANAVVLRLANTSLTLDQKLGLRHGASTDDWDANIGSGTHLQGVAALRDDNLWDDNLWDEYMESASSDVYVAAYTLLLPADVHADVDILIRAADGSVRETIATNVSNSRSITETAWQTLKAKYQFPGYTIVDDTDYLEIDLFADATNNTASSSVSLAFRVDDDDSALNDMTPVREVGPVVAQTVASGSYVGNATPGRSITGLSFQPDLLIIKGDTNQVPVFRSSTMPTSTAKILLKLALQANLIESLDIEGFTIGDDPGVNDSGVTYHWTAFKAKPGEFVVGTYTGNGSSQSITGMDYQPEAIIVFPATADEVNIKTAAMPASLAMQLDDEDRKTNRITSMDPDGFTVGQSGQSNGQGKTYHYVAWNEAATRMAQGSYEGDGTDGRSFAGVGFKPQYLIVKANVAIEGAHHPNSLGESTDSTLSMMAKVNYVDGIQALESDGFQVGADSTVNGAATTYFWIAFNSGQQ